MSDLLRVESLNKSFGTHQVLTDINCQVKKGEFISILGPSGCGKTTLLRTIAGLEAPSSGKIYHEDVDITEVRPDKRGFSIVFQDYALFPHMTLYDNVAYGLKARKVPAREIKPRVDEALELVQISHLADRKPNELSGGQQQRVALARTLTQDPHIILADEPVAALDPVTAKQVMEDFVHINQELGISILLNIHHVELALEYADRVIGIRAGKIVYDGPSKQVDQAVLDAIYGEDAVSEAAV